MVKSLFSFLTRPTYHMIESGIQLSYSPTAGDFKIAIPASTLDTIAAGVPLCVFPTRLPLTMADKNSHLHAYPIQLPGRS